MLRDIKHLIKKILGIKDYWWYQDKFESSIKSQTWLNREASLDWAENCLKNKEIYESESDFNNSNDPIVRQGYELKKKAEKEFKNKLSGKINERVLIQIIDWKTSPAGYSLFTNIKESLNFIGVPADELAWNENISVALERFKPTIFLLGDHSVYLSRIDWSVIKKYKEKNTLKVGLTASLEEYGNTPLAGRLEWAKENNIDFYYTFREESYIKARKEYKPFFEKGYSIFSIPFGANPLIHYPLPNIKKTLDYVFIASVNKTKAQRYLKFMNYITKKYNGFIDGPGWKKTSDFSFNRNRDRYIYAKSKVGLNIHLEEQIEWANETSERTYQLAMCGVPQVTDHAKVFDILFKKDSLFIADTAKEYRDKFESILKNPELTQKHALQAQKEVFEKYTTFHRAEKFVTMVSNHFK